MAYPKVIVMTGTPGTGKSTLAEKLSLSKYWKLIRIKDFIKKHDLAESFDAARHSYVVDQKKMSKLIIQEISSLSSQPGVEVILIEGHMAHFLPSKGVDLCIVAKTGLSELNKRLTRRGYSREKVQENLESEIFDICLEEARQAGHRILVLDTTKNGLNTLVDKVHSVLSQL